MKKMTDMTDAQSACSLLEVDLQLALEDADLEEPPSGAMLRHWAQQAYANICSAESSSRTPAEVTIRLVAADEIQSLNRQFRNKDQVTNVLAFPIAVAADIQAEMAVQLLGDVIICHPIIVREAQQQAKTTVDHYAHMVTHGILHLCGYDHQRQQEAEQMEAFEAHILAQSNIANPYS